MPATRLLRLLVGVLLAASAVAGAERLRVGVDVDAKPLTYLDQHGQPQGFALDIMRAVAREMEFEVEFVPSPWPQMNADFQAGKLDAIANIGYTDERAKYIAFSSPHLVTPSALFVRRGGPVIRQFSDLRDLRIAVKTGSPAYHYLIAHGSWQHLVTAPSPHQLFTAVEQGQTDVAIDARLIGEEFIREGRFPHAEVSPLNLPDLALQFHAGFHPDDHERLARFNSGLARLAANRTYDHIYARWFEPPDSGRASFRALRPYLVPAGLVFAAGLALLAWQRRLLRRLARQTEALRTSQERLSVVLEGTDDGFWDWDIPSGRVERSVRFASMLGYRLDEIPPTVEGGRCLIHPDDQKTLARVDARLLRASDQRHDIEFRMRAKNGEWRWILNRGKVVARASDGTALRMAGTHTDVTDLRRARDEAARQEARFRILHENVPVGLSWMELGRPETRLTNPAYARITGVPESGGHTPEAYIAATHPDDRVLQSTIEERLQRGEIDQATFEKRYVHPDGRIVWAIMSIHVFRDPAFGGAQKVTTLVDLSDRKRTEAEREALSAKMLEAQKLESLGVLAGGIAHDFNNLLTVILANASFARQEGQLTEQRIAPIETAARRAADLCRQMLAYAGKGSVLLEQVALDALVRETAQLLHVSISKKAHLDLDLAPDLPVIDADASQVRQIVMNLVINASEALGEAPGTIRLALRRARPEAPAPDRVVHRFDLPASDCICLEVADTGHGMSAATLSRIFDPFFTTKFTGRGLGLAAVLGIVRAHHGALTVESALGRGTTFRLYLPASRQRLAPAAARSAAGPASAAHPQGTILIADDEPAVLATVDIMIRRRGYRTVLATNGDEAVQRFTADPDGFAAVVLDLTMPGRDGAEVLAAIRAERAFTRVLVMSGFSEADIVERLRGCGEVVILRKPFTQETLLERLNAALAPEHHA